MVATSCFSRSASGLPRCERMLFAFSEIARIAASARAPLLSVWAAAPPRVRAERARASVSLRNVFTWPSFSCRCGKPLWYIMALPENCKNLYRAGVTLSGSAAGDRRLTLWPNFMSSVASSMSAKVSSNISNAIRPSSRASWIPAQI
mgnify:CR=1 FL=1